MVRGEESLEEKRKKGPQGQQARPGKVKEILRKKVGCNRLVLRQNTEKRMAKKWQAGKRTAYKKRL